jgi:hypothetical protein
VLQALRRILKLRIEIADAQPRQGRLDVIDDAGLLASEGLALAVGAFGIFLLYRWDRRHLAVLPLAAQPSENGVFELFGIEPVGLRAAVLALTATLAAWMTWASIARARSQRASQKPSAISSPLAP